MRPNTNLEGLTADQIIAILGMSPHPEGGYYVETYRDPNAEALGLPALADRGSVTCIYFLLKSGESSHWHRVQGVEVWHHYLGAPLLLRIAQRDEDMPTSVQLGSDFSSRGERAPGVVPSGAWQAAECLADDPAGYSLVGCTVSPGFTFDGFELAAPAWALAPTMESK